MLSTMRWASLLVLLSASCGSKKNAAPAPTRDEPAKAAIADALPASAKKPEAAPAAAAKPARPEHTVWKLVDNRHAPVRIVVSECRQRRNSLGLANCFQPAPYGRAMLLLPTFHQRQDVKIGEHEQLRKIVRNTE